MTATAHIPAIPPLAQDALPPVCFTQMIDGQRFDIRGTLSNRFGEQVYQVWRDNVPLCNVATVALGVRWVERATRKPRRQAQRAALRAQLAALRGLLPLA